MSIMINEIRFEPSNRKDEIRCIMVDFEISRATERGGAGGAICHQASGSKGPHN